MTRNRILNRTCEVCIVLTIIAAMPAFIPVPDNPRLTILPVGREFGFPSSGYVIQRGAPGPGVRTQVQATTYWSFLGLSYVRGTATALRWLPSQPNPPPTNYRAILISHWLLFLPPATVAALCGLWMVHRWVTAEAEP